MCVSSVTEITASSGHVNSGIPRSAHAVPRPCQSSSAGSQQRPGRRAAAAAVLDAVSTAGMAWQHGDASFAETLARFHARAFQNRKGKTRSHATLPAISPSVHPRILLELPHHPKMLCYYCRSEAYPLNQSHSR